MKTAVIGLGPFLDRDAHLNSSNTSFKDDYAFVRENMLRCFTPNLSTIAVTNCLQKNNYDVHYIDLVFEFGLPFNQLRREEWVKRIEIYFAQNIFHNIFISCVSSAEHLALVQFCKAVKKVNSKVIIGVGSYHANALRGRLLKNIPELDFVFLGDIELRIDELMCNLASGSLVQLNNMTQVITKDPSQSDKKKKVPDPKPSESEFNYAYCQQYLPFYDSMASIGMKGCPYTCSFCQEKIVRPGFQKRSAGKVVEETIKNYALYEEICGHRYVGYGFMEPIFGMDKKWCGEFFAEMVQSENKMYWGAQSRVGQLDEEILAGMAKAGCKLLYLGLENYSPSMLLKMNKTNKPEKYLNQFQKDIGAASKYGIAVETNLLFGYPGETVKTLAENEKGIMDTLTKYPSSSINLNLFRPLPGTDGLSESDLGGEAKLLVPNWWEEAVIPGLTVLVQPSDEVTPAMLIEFQQNIYNKANCYNRRGVDEEIVKLLDKGAMLPEDLTIVSKIIKEKLWRLTN